MKKTLSLTLIILTFVLYIFSKTASAEYYVRTIYFHPSDVPPHANSISTLRSLVDSTKQFFAGEMANHGFGSKTFTTETDTSGNTLVHTVTGQSTNAEYAAGTGDITQEVGEVFDLSLNVVYLIWVDYGSSASPDKDYSTLRVGGWGSGTSFSGSAQVSGVRVHIANEISHVYDRALVGIAHELGHTFGLPHDFRDNFYLMSYGNPINQDQLSFCSAKWLDASRYFNSSQTSSDPFSATMSMSTPTLVSTPNTIRFSFQLTDTDGLHQAVLLSEFTDGGGVVDCKSLSGDSASVEFDTTEIGTANTYVILLVMDEQGNFTSKGFDIDVSSILTVTGNAEIPDTSLAESIRNSLNLASNAAITKQKMWELRTFTAKGATGFINDPIGTPITDLTGLEHAINLEFIDIGNHSVSSFSPLSGLTKLKTMIAQNNEVSNISSLAGLTQLESLILARNQISDITPLAGLTRLALLELSFNQIVDIGPLRTLTNLSQLYLTNNQIKDVNPLTGLVKLLTLGLGSNPITDQTPLQTLKNQNPDLQITIDAAPVVTNNPPVFSDSSITLSVQDNAEAGTSIGSPVTASDTDTGDTLTYTLGGTDATSFDIDSNTGQLKTKATLDYDTKNSYTVEVSVSDGREGTASITVTINVTQEGEDQPSEIETEDPTIESEVDETTPISGSSTQGQVSFSELMFTSKGGLHSLAQWMELYNNSKTNAVNLKGWQLTIEARDANGKHRHVLVTLEDLSIPPDQTVLMVTWNAQRKSEDFSENDVYNFFSHHSDEFEQNTHRNMVLGFEGFFLKLTTPDGTVSDVIGNIDGDPATSDEPMWEIPSGTTQNGARASILRRYDMDTRTPLDGKDLNNWVSTSNFPLLITRYWGSITDIGNPGYRGNSAVPVTLSHFTAELTNIGVILEWITESEVDNAGFYIYRSETKESEFKVVNPTMIQGAGTTGERNKYSWTDTTAKPNTFYYYRIEDVSHAGVREQLATVRLRGLVSTSGKLTTRWADLKI